MNPYFQILLLTIISVTQASPVVYIIYNKVLNPLQVLSSAIIATEKYIITTKNPLSTYVISELCALAIADFTDFTEAASIPHIQQRCINIKKTHHSKLISLLELEKDMVFLYRLNTAMIPAVTNISSPRDLTKNCKILYNDRNKTFEHIERQKLEPGTLTLDANEPTMRIALDKELQFCVQDNGMPLFCESAVIGIFTFKSSSGSCCSNECKPLKADIGYVKLFSQDVQDLLKKYIKNRTKKEKTDAEKKQERYILGDDNEKNDIEVMAKDADQNNWKKANAAANLHKFYNTRGKTTVVRNVATFDNGETTNASGKDTEINNKDEKVTNLTNSVTEDDTQLNNEEGKLQLTNSEGEEKKAAGNDSNIGQEVSSSNQKPEADKKNVKNTNNYNKNESEQVIGLLM